jgi:ABC-type lipoprotein export system ATPase subunit
MTQEKPNSKLTVPINADAGFWKDKNFEYEFGDFTVITGVNGSGKTKLLEYIAKNADITSKQITRFVETSYKIPHEQYMNEIRSQTSYTFDMNNVNDQGLVSVKELRSGNDVY